MKNWRALTLLFVLVLTVAAGGAAAAAPQAPTLLSPADNAGVEVPFAISWAAVSDPDGVVAYNWQASSVSSFASIVLQDSTNGETQDTVSGLPNGTYFWRVQAVSGAFVQGAWSQARRFDVTGAGPGEPGSPSLAPTQAYSTFHPFETITFNWTAVPDAATYDLEAATDPSFPIVSRIHIDNIPAPTMTFAIAGPQGNYWARVYAVNANGIAGVPSNVITFSVFYNNPIGPAPSPVSPPNGSTLTLPVTLTWADVPNPQPSGYELQISKNSSFSAIEEDDPQLNGPSRVLLSLTAGPKFWRARSAQGDSSPSTAALTAWSSAGTFTIPTGPSLPVSVALAKDPLYGGETTWVQLQLTSAVPSTGATISLASSSPAALPVPATIAMPGTTAWTQFEMNQFGMKAGQVTAPTPVTLTATLNGASASGQFTVMPPSLQSLFVSSSISGGAQAGGIVMLNGQAPAGGAVVSLSSDSPAVSPPTTVAVEPGIESVSFSIPTSSVTTNTTATLTATWNGVTRQAQVTLTPQQPPASITLSPTTVVGLGGSSFATVRVATANTSDEILQVTSSNPAVASVNSSVMIPSGTTAGGFNIFTSSVAAQTLVTISVSGGGVNKSATLTVNPQPPSLSALTVSPSSVAGGNASTGTVTLTAAAPGGGASIALSSSRTTVASVPASVTIPAGATSATFAVTTTAVTTNNSVTITATGGTSRTATLTVTAAPAAASFQSVTVTPTSATGGTNSQGKVTLSAGAPQGGAVVALSSGNPGLAGVPASVTIPAGATSATFAVTTAAVATNTSVILTASYNGVNKTATLTVTPPASLQSVTVTPTSVTGGTSSQGKATLSAVAPQGGAVVALSSGDPGLAGVPASVTIPAGTTSANFAVTTTSVSAATGVTISAGYNSVTRTATLSVTPPGQAATLTVTATGRSGERITSSPAGINVAVGSTGSAPFAGGTPITLSVSNGRDAVWSGACSSGGNKTKTCAFTLAGNSSVGANVQ
jgi:hypothetical protein